MMITLIIVGQLAVGLLIDHFGLFGVPTRPVTPPEFRRRGPARHRRLFGREIAEIYGLQISRSSKPGQSLKI